MAGKITKEKRAPGRTLTASAWAGLHSAEQGSAAGRTASSLAQIVSRPKPPRAAEPSSRLQPKDCARMGLPQAELAARQADAASSPGRTPGGPSPRAAPAEAPSRTAPANPSFGPDGPTSLSPGPRRARPASGRCRARHAGPRPCFGLRRFLRSPEPTLLPSPDAVLRSIAQAAPRSIAPAAARSVQGRR